MNVRTERRPRREVLHSHWVVVAVALLSLVLNLYLMHAHPARKSWGDEKMYFQHAHSGVSRAEKLQRLVPGFMPFDHWAPLPLGIYGLFAREPLARASQEGPGSAAPNVVEWNGEAAAFLRRVSIFHVLLLVFTGLNVYAICLLLGAGRPAAVTASCAILLNPRLLFYVQTLWPELLHLALLTSAFLLLIRFHGKRDWRLVAGSGALFGVCALTKGVVEPYCLLLLFILPYLLWRRGGMALKRALLTVAVFYGSYSAVILPQKAANYAHHGLFAVAPHKWVNIECGIAHDTAIQDVYTRYLAASEDPATRERLSRERVFAYLQENPPLGILMRQVRQFGRNQLMGSFLFVGFEEGRWGDPSLEHVAPSVLLFVTILLSYALLLGGCLGLAACGYRSFGGALLGVYTVYYLASLLLVGFNCRFFVQAVPVLAIAAASFVPPVIRRWAAGPRRLRPLFAMRGPASPGTGAG